MASYKDFEDHISQINDLCCVINLLIWDARTQMPVGGNETCERQIGTMARLAQELFDSGKTAQLQDAVEAEIDGEDPDSFRVRSVRQAKETYELTRRVPVKLVAKPSAARIKNSIQELL